MCCIRLLLSYYYRVTLRVMSLLFIIYKRCIFFLTHDSYIERSIDGLLKLIVTRCCHCDCAYHILLLLLLYYSAYAGAHCTHIHNIIYIIYINRIYCVYTHYTQYRTCRYRLEHGARAVIHP